MSQPHQPEKVIIWELYPPQAEPLQDQSLALIPKAILPSHDVAQKPIWTSRLLHLLGIKKDNVESATDTTDTPGVEYKTPEMIENERVIAMLQRRLASVRKRQEEPKKSKDVIYFSSGRARIRIPGLDT